MHHVADVGACTSPEVPPVVERGLVAPAEPLEDIVNLVITRTP